MNPSDSHNPQNRYEQGSAFFSRPTHPEVRRPLTIVEQRLADLVAAKASMLRAVPSAAKTEQTVSQAIINYGSQPIAAQYAPELAQATAKASLQADVFKDQATNAVAAAYAAQSNQRVA